jgi:hypothetical protein
VRLGDCSPEPEGLLSIRDLLRMGPLWVISGHQSLAQRMSAIPSRADMISIGINVR